MKTSARLGISVVLAALVAPIVLSGCTSAASVATSAASTSASAPAPASASPSASPSESSSSLLSPEQALDMYVKAEQSQIDQVLEQNKGAFKSLKITSEAPGTTIFEFTMAKKMDLKAAKKYFDSMIPTFDDLLKKQGWDAMTKIGVVEPKVRYIYLNPDGTSLWKHTFEPKA